MVFEHASWLHCHLNQANPQPFYYSALAHLCLSQVGKSAVVIYFLVESKRSRAGGLLLHSYVAHSSKAQNSSAMQWACTF